MEIDKDLLLEALGKHQDSPEILVLIDVINCFFETSKYEDEDLEYLMFYEKGISLMFEKERLAAIHLFLGHEQEFKDFSGWIGDGLGNKMHSPDDVISKLGEPSVIKLGTKDELEWIRYDSNDYSAHYTWNENNDSQIALVTLMAANNVPK